MRRLFFRWAAAALLAGALMIPAAEAAQLLSMTWIVEPSRGMDRRRDALGDAGRPVPGGGRIHAELEWDSGGR